PNKTQRDFQLVSFGQKAPSVFQFRLKIISADNRGNPNFLKGNNLLILPRLSCLSLLFVAELTVIHKATNRYFRIRSDAYQIQIYFLGHPSSYVNWFNS